jgi:hypothetical protein
MLLAVAAPAREVPTLAGYCSSKDKHSKGEFSLPPTVVVYDPILLGLVSMPDRDP